ncbi:MAG: hypothetical protein GDA50_04880 [Alphaproteobacteria bacterium GM202ARS2]|nr:hypothetical protein [Alphaproteobacteria bacterium GM202ARS2]
MMNNWRRLLRSRRSIWFVMYAFAVPSVLALGGASIDYYRLHMVKTRLIHAADAASLAAAGVQQKEQQEEIARSYVKSLFPDNYLGSDKVKIRIKTEEQTASSAQTVEVRVSTTMPMHYISMGGLVEGLDAVPVDWVSRSAWGIDSVEVILVVDYSGSMGTNDGCSGSGVPCTRLKAVQDVAAEFISLLLPNDGGDSSDDSIHRSVGLVPFADFVAFDPRQLDVLLRLGRSTASDALINQHSYGVRAPRADRNKPCLANRLRRGPQFYIRPLPHSYNFGELFDINDARPSADDPQTWFYAQNLFMSYGYRSAAVCDLRVSSNPHGLSYGNIDPGDTSYGASTIRRSFVVPLTSERTVLLNTLHGLTPSGATMIIDGLKWAVRLLSPDWRGVWLAPGTDAVQASVPRDSNGWSGSVSNTGVGTVRKYIILLTDGLQSLPNQSSYGFEQYRRCPDFYDLRLRSTQFAQDFSYSGLDRFCASYAGWGYHILRGMLHKTSTNADILAESIPQHNTASLTNYYFAQQTTFNMGGEIRERVIRELCPQIERYGVRFFGIGFRFGTAERGRSILLDCVEDENRFFADNVDQLRQVFENIASRISHSQRLVPIP